MDLPSEKTDYVSKQFKCFIPEKVVKENSSILHPATATGSVVEVKKVDGFVKFIMGQSTLVLNQETRMINFQSSIIFWM